MPRFHSAVGPVLAQTCGNYPLTPEQSDALQKARLDVVVPEGEVPFVQRCDIDGNEIIDRADIVEISKSRNQPASDPDDPRDWNENGQIDVLDARGCVLSCTFPRCASGDPRRRVPGNNVAKVRVQNTVGQPGKCFESADFSGDGNNDFMGIFEYVGNQPRGNNWDLQMVILYEDAAGDTQVVAYPYTGQTSRDGRSIFQHLSVQPPGTVDLQPGSITLSRPGMVSYRNNLPETLYYISDGRVRRAFYRVDD